MYVFGRDMSYIYAVRCIYKNELNVFENQEKPKQEFDQRFLVFVINLTTLLVLCHSVSARRMKVLNVRHLEK